MEGEFRCAKVGIGEAPFCVRLTFRRKRRLADMYAAKRQRHGWFARDESGQGIALNWYVKLAAALPLRIGEES